MCRSPPSFCFYFLMILACCLFSFFLGGVQPPTIETWGCMSRKPFGRAIVFNCHLNFGSDKLSLFLAGSSTSPTKVPQRTSNTRLDNFPWVKHKVGQSPAAVWFVPNLDQLWAKTVDLKKQLGLAPHPCFPCNPRAKVLSNTTCLEMLYPWQRTLQLRLTILKPSEG